MKKEDFYSWLEEESKTWISEGIITDEQARKILSKSDVSLSEKEVTARGNKIISYITGLGAILIGIGIIAFFASNWERIPKAAKLLAIYISLFATYYFGFSLAFIKKTYPRVGTALLLLGSIIFGSAIFLLAQIYNINAHYPNGLLLWGIGVLPLAYVLSSRAILTLSVGILSTWLGTELSFWLEHRYYYASEATYFFTIYGAWSVFLYSFGTVHTKFEATKYFAGVYRYLGMIGILFVSFLLGFRDIRQGVLQSDIGFIPKIALIILVIAGIINIAIGLMYKRPPSKIFTYEMQGLGLFFIILVASAFIPEPRTGYSNYGYYHGNMVYPIIYNLVMLAACIGIVLLGYANKNISYVNMGTSFIGLQIFARYVEWSWDLMDRSLFFLVGGILLLAIGYVLEKQRRKVVKQIRI